MPAEPAALEPQPATWLEASCSELLARTSQVLKQPERNLFSIVDPQMISANRLCRELARPRQRSARSRSESEGATRTGRSGEEWESSSTASDPAPSALPAACAP